jgi:hypothetical protein
MLLMEKIFLFSMQWLPDIIALINVNKVDMLNLNVRINTDIPFGEGSEI